MSDHRATEATSGSGQGESRITDSVTITMTVSDGRIEGLSEALKPLCQCLDGTCEAIRLHSYRATAGCWACVDLLDALEVCPQTGESLLAAQEAKAARRRQRIARELESKTVKVGVGSLIVTALTSGIQAVVALADKLGWWGW